MSSEAEEDACFIQWDRSRSLARELNRLKNRSSKFRWGKAFFAAGEVAVEVLVWVASVGSGDESIGVSGGSVLSRSVLLSSLGSVWPAPSSGVLATEPSDVEVANGRVGDAGGFGLTNGSAIASELGLEGMLRILDQGWGSVCAVGSAEIKLPKLGNSRAVWGLPWAFTGWLCVSLFTTAKGAGSAAGSGINEFSTRGSLGWASISSSSGNGSKNCSTNMVILKELRTGGCWSL